MRSESHTAEEFAIIPSDAERSLLSRVQRLCPPPKVSMKVIALARDPNVDLAELARCIEMDPTLTAQLLQTVNSAQFGLVRPITTVALAVPLLGLKPLRLLVTAFTVLNPLSSRLPHAIYHPYWKRSLTTAFAARGLAKADCPDEIDLSFTAGLLSDIGVLAFCQVHGATYQQLYSEWNLDPSRLVAEELRCWGTDHIRLGALLAQNFNLDLSVVRAILGLSAASTTPSDLTPLAQRTRMAYLLSSLLAHKDQHRWLALREEIRQQYELDTDAFLDLVLEVHDELHNWSQVFKLDVPELDEAQFRTAAQDALVQLAIGNAAELSLYESFFGNSAYPPNRETFQPNEQRDTGERRAES